jgi:hypothetical protein
VVPDQQEASRTESDGWTVGENSQRLLKMEPTRDDWTTRSSHFTSATIYKTGLVTEKRTCVMGYTHSDNQFDTESIRNKGEEVIRTKLQSALTRTPTYYPVSKHEFR